MADDGLRRFGWFSALFKPNGPEIGTILQKYIHPTIASSTHLTEEIMALLAESNWRPQLVGAVAMCCGATTPVTIQALWDAFDQGSWVSPQLAVTAFRCDFDFEHQARQRIEHGCPIQSEQLENMDWAVRYSAAGPISLNMHSRKALDSLVYLCGQLPTANEWLTAVLARPEIQNALAQDTDSGAFHTAHWLQAIREVIPGAC